MDVKASRTQADLKFHNLKLIYSLIRNEGPLSRIALSKRAGLSATSMTRIISTLTEMGLVCEHSIDSLAGIGRPATLLDICPDAAYCLCLDMMLNCCKVALANLQGKFVAHREIAVPAGMSFVALADEITAIVPELAQEAGADPGRIVGCGMSLTGHVLNETGFIVASSQFQWYQIDARAILEKRLNLPVVVENDCKSALVGEVNLLVKENIQIDNIAYLQLGWAGVGGAAIVDGRLLRGSRNAAGEIGHTSAQPDGEVCNCGHTGCFETMISEQFVLRKAQRIDAAYDSVEKISAGLKAGDERLSALVDQVGEYIAIAVNDLSCAYNPEAIILNGALLVDCEPCYESAKKHLKMRLLESIQPRLAVRTARMGTDASLYGIGCIGVEQAIDWLLKAKIRNLKA